jgi:hypothetical protein
LAQTCGNEKEKNIMIMDTSGITVSPEVNRLLVAAVISDGFQNLLLKDPSQAVRRGHQGEFFKLTDHEMSCVLGVCARDMADFANQLFSNLQKVNTGLAMRVEVMA